MIPTAQQILQFCATEYGTRIASNPGEVNIIYLEGANIDLSPNKDLPDQWNDVRCVITHDVTGRPKFDLLAMATSEPGLSATNSKRAEKTGGVFRIAIGYHHEKWRNGFHKGNRNHPALVQVAPILGTRDKNRDGKRTGDLVTNDVMGLNQHGTRPGLLPVRVGEFSYACLVGREWDNHLKFIRLCREDRRFLNQMAFNFSSTVVDYSHFWAWFLKQQ